MCRQRAIRTAEEEKTRILPAKKARKRIKTAIINMEKDTKFIILMHEDDEGKVTVENYFTINDEVMTYADITTEEKYRICDALRLSMGVLAKITLKEMEAEQERKKGEMGKQDQDE